MQRWRAVVGLTVLLSFSPAGLFAYSVLAHEATIDVTWDGTIQPLLLRRFPHTSREQLVRARSFAYGGSVIQDFGYYPFGNKFFSNLVHYVRSGDFVEALIRDSQDVDELAFALGALAHYVNDTTGHAEAVNLALPMMFPKLERRLGDTITYAQAPREHINVEFSFDIVQLAGGAYVPDAYKRWVGFRVATPLLKKAFRETYGFDIDDVFANTDRAIATYRYSVSQILPALTEAAWRDEQNKIRKLTPSVERTAFVFSYPRADFERDYGKNYQKPRLFARLIGSLYSILPKIGPLKALRFKAPTAEAEALFVKSFRDATARFRSAASRVGQRQIHLTNVDFDTGVAPRRGENALADDTYAELLERLSRRQFVNTPIALKRDILAFYGDALKIQVSGRERKRWPQLEDALRHLAQGPTAN
jgi:hypothetical protein